MELVWNGPSKGTILQQQSRLFFLADNSVIFYQVVTITATDWAGQELNCRIQFSSWWSGNLTVTELWNCKAVQPGMCTGIPMGSWGFLGMDHLEMGATHYVQTPPNNYWLVINILLACLYLLTCTLQMCSRKCLFTAVPGTSDVLRNRSLGSTAEVSVTSQALIKTC